MPMDYGYNPYQFQQSRTPIDNLIRVSGIEGAKAYQVPPNSKIALFDATEDIFYVKATDGTGYPSVRTFVFQEVLPQEAQMPDMSAYVTKEDFQSLSDKVTELINALGGGSNGE